MASAIVLKPLPPEIALTFILDLTVHPVSGCLYQYFH